MAQARPYGDYGRVVNWQIDESLVSYERERLDVEERGKRVAVAARHVCILLRRFRALGDVTRPYVRALGRGAFHTCWSAAVRSATARRSSHCAMRLSRSNGRITSLGSLRPCAVRFLPSATKRSSPSDSKCHSYGILPCQTEPCPTSCSLPLSARSPSFQYVHDITISQSRDVTPAAVAGAVRSVLCWLLPRAESRDRAAQGVGHHCDAMCVPATRA